MTRQAAAARRRLLLALAAAVPVAGCAALGPVAPRAPTLAFATLRMAGAGPEGLRLEIAVECTNPNAFDLPLSALRFELELLGTPFATGSALDEPLTIPAGQSRPVTLHVTVPPARLRELVRRVRPTDVSGFDYRVHGSVRWGASGLTLPFDRSGHFSPLGPPRDRAR